MLAKRDHPLENIIYSFERLNPTFLAEQTLARKVISPQNAPEIVIFGDWEQIERSKGIHLPGTVPFLGEGRNDQAKRVTGNFLATIAKMIHTNKTAIVSVNNTPFKSLPHSPRRQDRPAKPPRQHLGLPNPHEQTPMRHWTGRATTGCTPHE